MPEVQEDNSYINLISKAYIEPIKSVLAIDDQYQSLDNILKNLQSGTPLTANAELTRQIQTLEMVRNNNWLADMHNGQTDSDSTIFDRLHQCDLLLLDYHLDENEQDDPEKALNILSKLNQNHHFNLVIVYTAASNLNKVRSEIFTKLSSSKNELFSKPTQGAEQLLEQWSDDGESYQDDMLESITRSDLETVLSTPSIIDEPNEFTAIFTPIDLILSAENQNLSDDLKQQLYINLLKLKVEEFKHTGDFSGHSAVKVSTNASSSMWLKTEKLFIAVISKEQVVPNDLPTALTSALEDWRPTNNRLLLSKIKSELDDNGQTFENEILSCEYTNAGWLKQFYDESNGMDITVSRLMEGLSNALCNSQELTDFSSLIKQRIESIGLNNEIIKESSSIDNPDTLENKIKLYKALNTYIGTKDIEGDHLMTGHVIEWSDDVPEKREYFLCLTPACDLVPGRINPNNYKGYKTDLNPYLPLKTIRLIKQDNEKKTLKEINKKPIIILKVNGEMICFKASEDGRPVFDEQIFANHQGVFESIFGIKTVEIHRTFLDKLELRTEKRQCRIVAHLRYEYALNLLQRLGQDLTKIGLDYQSLS
jgi:CheY-like chemotaxis protein